MGEFSGKRCLATQLSFSHLGGIGIDMLLTPLHKKRSSKDLPSADYSDGALSSFRATSLFIRIYQKLVLRQACTRIHITLDVLHKTICCIEPRLCIMLEVNFREIVLGELRRTLLRRSSPCPIASIVWAQDAPGRRTAAPRKPCLLDLNL